MTGTRHARFKRALFEEVCARLRRDPTLVENGRRYMERFMAPDPRMQRYYALWREVIELPVDEICDRLLADTPEGEALRDSCPVFTVLPHEVRMRLARDGRLDEAV
ncbi:MAG: hypothetical protein IRZ04_10415 [Rhodospirillales bacterium]|nr:hypothetical protein [Rhodospirillales bacterium]